MENNNKQSNILPLVIIFAVIVALIGGAYWFGKSNVMRTPSEEEISDVREPEQVVVEEEEEEPVEEESTEPGEESEEETDETEGEEIIDEEAQETDEVVVDLFKQLFAEKYSKDVEEVNFEISEREGDYLTGGVKFEGEISGGYVLGAKVNDEWKIIFDGNGNYTCGVVDVVDFPSSLAPECWDENTMQMVDRTAE
jgi:hypothetical protein